MGFSIILVKQRAGLGARALFLTILDYKKGITVSNESAVMEFDFHLYKCNL